MEEGWSNTDSTGWVGESWEGEDLSGEVDGRPGQKKGFEER